MAHNPNQFLPLRPVDLQLLIALAEHEQHGYGLVQEIARATDGLLTLDPGNLYRVIKRLVDAKLIAESDHRPAPELGNERRRYYELTPLGERVLAAELERLHGLVNAPGIRRLIRKLAT